MRLERFIKSITSREQWNKENGDLQPNNILDAYLLAEQLEAKFERDSTKTQKAEFERLSGQAKVVVESLASKADEKVVSAYGQFYTEEAQSPQVDSRTDWLRLGFASVALLVISLGLLLCFDTTATIWSEASISHLIEKLLLLSILGFLARFGFHQYSIRMNLLSFY